MARRRPALLLAAAAALLLALAPAAQGYVVWTYPFPVNDYYLIKQGSGVQTFSLLANDGTLPSGVVVIDTSTDEPGFDYGSNTVGQVTRGSDGTLTINPTSAGIQKFKYANTYGGAQSPDARVTIVVVPAAANPNYYAVQSPTWISNTFEFGPVFNDFPDASLNWTSNRVAANNFRYLEFYDKFRIQFDYVPPFPPATSTPAFSLDYGGSPQYGGVGFEYPDNWYGEYTFSYFVVSTHPVTGVNVTSAPANVTIRVNAGPRWVNPSYIDKPPPPLTTPKNAPLTVSKATILSYFTDPDNWPKPLDVILRPFSASDGGTVVQNADGSLTLTPVKDFTGLVTADVYITDGFFNLTTDWPQVFTATVAAIVGKGKPLLPVPTMGAFTADCSVNNGRVFPAPITAGSYSLVGAASMVGAPAGLDFIIGLSSAVNGKGGCIWSSLTPVDPGATYLPALTACTGKCAACLTKFKSTTFCGKSLRIWVRARAFSPFIASPLVSTGAFTMTCAAAAQCTGM